MLNGKGSVRLAVAAGLLVALGASVGEAAVITRVQSTNGNGTSSGAAATWGAATTAGNLLVAVMSCRGGSSAVMASPGGQSWTLAVRSNQPSAGSEVAVAIYYMANAASQSGAQTWTCSGTANNWGNLFLIEYSGAKTSAVLDVTATDIGIGDAASDVGNTGTTATTTQAREVSIVAFAQVATGGWTLNNGYTSLGFASNASTLGTNVGDKVITSTGTQNATANQAHYLTWAAAIATFKEQSVSLPATRYWIGAGSGNFTDDARWSTASGGANDTLAPDSAVTAVFTSSGTGTCTINSTVSLTGITINSGAGTVTQGSGNNVTLSGTFTQAGGTYNGSTGRLNIGGSLNLSSGTFAASSGAIDVDGNIGASGGTFTGSSSAITVDGNLTLSGTSFTSTSGLLKIGGAFNKTAGSFTHNSGRVMLSSTDDQAFASHSAAFNHLIVNDGLVGYWKLDETSGTSAADSSGYGLSGTYSGTAPTQNSASPPSLDFANTRYLTFNGSSSSVSMASGGGRFNFTSGQSYTLSAWVSATNLASGTYQGVVTISRDATPWWGLWIDTPTPQWMSGSPSQAALGAAVTAGWHHVVVVQDGSANRQYIYVDGVDTTVGTPTAQNGNGGGTIYFGRSSVGEYFTGSIDEIRMYNRVLTISEINSLAIGKQPGSTTAVHTMTGAPTVAADLTIASGTLAAGTNNISVANSWWNYGGVVTSTTGSVTFNGTGSHSIRSSGQVFQNVNITGAGTWTLADRMEIDPSRTLTTTAGGFALSSYTLRAGDIARNAAVTITPNSGLVVLGGNASQVIDAGTFNDVRFEPVSATNLVGYWKLDEGQGGTTRDYSGNSLPGTLNGPPRWIDSSLPGITFENPGALLFDGSGDFVSIGEAAVATNGSYSVCAWVKLTATAGYQTFVSIDGTNASSFYLQKRGDTGRFALASIPTDSTGTAVKADSTTTPSAGTWYHLCGTFDGTNQRIYVNGGLEDTQAFGTAWAASGSTIIGAGKYGGARVDYLNGQIDDVRIYNTALSLTAIGALAAGRYPVMAGTPTYTLGYNTTVASDFALDSGGFSTGTGYTMNASSSSGDNHIYSGTYTVGNAATTFAGGLTVQAQGTLAMATSSGSLSIGPSEVLTIHGTLDVSPVATKPLLRSSSGNYTFNVSSTAVLDVDGLQVQNTLGNGMDIAEGVTLTQFRNVEFSGGTGTSYLKITDNSGYVTLQGFEFNDTNTTYNIAAVGDGDSTGTPTRILVEYRDSTTNGSGAGESRDRDDDTNDDGLPDTNNYGQAVVLWLYAARADTVGVPGSAAVGFPTAAFDWSDFSYYSTYYVVANHASNVDRIFVRANNGDPKGATYHYDLAVGTYGHIVGTPIWDTVGGVHYIYVGTDTGRILRFTDTGGAVTLTNTWTPSTLTKVTSPLVSDATYLYFGGQNGVTNYLYTINRTTGAHATASPVATTGTMVIAPARWVIGSTTYLYSGLPVGGDSKAHMVRWQVGTSTTLDHSVATGAYKGRIIPSTSYVYGADDQGTFWAVNPSSMATGWSYHDNTLHSGCAANSACSIKGGAYVSPVTSRAYFGDNDGHLYAVAYSSGVLGAVVNASWPFNPNSTTESFSTAPFYDAGIIVAGTTAGTLFLVDEDGGGIHVPTLRNTYQLGSAVTSISYDRTSPGNYMVGTAGGNLYYISRITGRNLVTNPGFESGTTGWTRTSGSGGINTTSVHGGINSIRETTNGGWWQQTITPSPGVTYTMSGWGRAVSGNCDIVLQAGAGATLLVSQASSVFTASWTQRTVTASIPANATWVNVIFRSGTDCYFDDFSLTKY